MEDSLSMPPAAEAGSFEGRTIIVSGAGGKLGRVICAALGAAGANVVVNDVKDDAVTEVVASLQRDGGHAVGVSLSATSGEEIVAKAIETFGNVHATINATLGAIPWKPFESTSNDDFRASFENNVLGPFSITRAAWPYFKKQNFGRVVNFTSDSMLGFPNASSYTFAKGALWGVNKTLALEGAAHNIHVNCVSPIAFVPQMAPHVERLGFSDRVMKAFWTRYKPEGNVPMILALVSEGCEANGELFATSGWAVGRGVMGYVAGNNEMRTVKECLDKVNGLCEKGTQDVFEPGTQKDFTEWQAGYVLGDSGTD